MLGPNWNVGLGVILLIPLDYLSSQSHFLGCGPLSTVKEFSALALVYFTRWERLAGDCRVKDWEWYPCSLGVLLAGLWVIRNYIPVLGTLRPVWYLDPCWNWSSHFMRCWLLSFCVPLTPLGDFICNLSLRYTFSITLLGA